MAIAKTALQLLPDPLRKQMRRTFDRLHYRDPGDLIKLGEMSSWNLRKSLLGSAPLVYSAGVGKDISFELALAKDFGATIYLFDPSPTGVTTANLPDCKHPRIHFSPAGLAGDSGERVFEAPVNPSEGSFRVGSNKSPENSIRFMCNSVSDLMKSNGHTRLDVLKMDIEGFEYGVIDDILNHNIRISQILTEFHHFLPGVDLQMTRKAIRQLEDAGYELTCKVGLDYTFSLKH